MVGNDENVGDTSGKMKAIKELFSLGKVGKYIVAILLKMCSV